MDSIHSWVNEDEVKRLAEGLNNSPSSNKEWAESAYKGEILAEPDSPEVKQIQSNAKATLASASAMAVASGMTTKKEAEVKPAEKVVTPVVAEKKLGTFEKIEALYVEKYAADGISVIDRDGDVLYDTLDNASLTQFSRSIMVGSSLMAVNDGAFGNTRIKATAKSVLEYVSMLTTRGPIVVVARLKSELTPADAAELSGQILKVANS